LYEEQPMSKDRRKFVILTVFDSVLIIILWLLSTVRKTYFKLLQAFQVTKGDNWPEIFLTEINIFESSFLKLSMFDIVIVGLLRTTILLIFFAGFRVEHWLPVAFTTSVSTFYIVLKILFFFKKDHGSLPQYLVILASLSVAWFELWVVPFKVLPGERRIQENASVGSSVRSILPSFLRRNRRRRLAAATETEGEYRSAIDYTTGKHQ
jgi:hypothetical protein